MQQTAAHRVAMRRHSEQFDAYISSVGDLILQDLRIPAYQRPYTWSVKNVRQLVSDLQHFRASGHYRLGTVILHDAIDYSGHAPQEEPSALDIVDGQQRYLTFGLIILALSTRSAELNHALSAALLERMENITIPRRRDGKSELNLRTNYEHLFQLVRSWAADELRDFTEFFLKECSVVVMKVRDLDAAFQLFDSQNTRGKALYPTDLLKAHHLREFSQTSTSREEILETVRKWDALEPEEIEHLFGAVLFPIKRWAANKPVPETGFTVAHVDLFKGINQGTTQYRWSHMALMAKATVDQYRATNTTLRQYGVIEEFEFPFQIQQPVIDGEMFFRMVDHYIAETRKAGIRREYTRDSASKAIEPARELQRMASKLEKLPPGIGNRYLRELFDCLLMAYIDRFGWHSVQQAAAKLAKRTYLLRARLQRVTKNSINNHALVGHRKADLAQQENLFVKISLAQAPEEILTLHDVKLTTEDQEKLKEPFLRLFEPWNVAAEEPNS